MGTNEVDSEGQWPSDMWKEADGGRLTGLFTRPHLQQGPCRGIETCIGWQHMPDGERGHMRKDTHPLFKVVESAGRTGFEIGRGNFREGTRRRKALACEIHLPEQWRGTGVEDNISGRELRNVQIRQ